MKELTPDNIITEARTWIGTPWHHGARLKGVGVDCSGLLLEVSRECGVDVEDPVNYTNGDEFDRMVSEISKYAYPVIESLLKTEAFQKSPGSLWTSLLKGDILVFRDRYMHNHCSFYNGEYVEEAGHIHAYNGSTVQKVVEDLLDNNWYKRIAIVFRYKAFVDNRAKYFPTPEEIAQCENDLRNGKHLPSHFSEDEKLTVMEKIKYSINVHAE